MKELAADKIPVAVACRVLKLSRQHYYRWLNQPVTAAEVVVAYRANALFDAHRDDPEFGYRFLAGEAEAAGQRMAERTAWRICRENGWWSAFGKKRAKNGKRPGPPVHDDLVRRDFTASGPNQLWLTDITADSALLWRVAERGMIAAQAARRQARDRAGDAGEGPRERP